MRLNSLVLTLSVIALFASADLFPDELAERFEAHIFKSLTHSTLPYRLLIPKKQGTGGTYPLVLFLHGSDERGTDNSKQLYAGLNIFADQKTMDRYPCFIVAPQCPKDMKWVDVDWKAERHKMSDSPTPALAMAIELVEELEKKFPIDRKRIYITGYSMGGFGTWDAIERRPDLFAAAVPVCGGGDETRAARISDVPMWAFHGALDQIVKVDRSRNMINAVVRAGGVPRYTEYPLINHFSWGLAYSDPRTFEWLFSQKNKEARYNTRVRALQ
jgi:predicted peptidase